MWGNTPLRNIFCLYHSQSLYICSSRLAFRLSRASSKWLDKLKPTSLTGWWFYSWSVASRCVYTHNLLQLFKSTKGNWSVVYSRYLGCYSAESPGKTKQKRRISDLPGPLAPVACLPYVWFIKVSPLWRGLARRTEEHKTKVHIRNQHQYSCSFIHCFSVVSLFFFITFSQ